MAVASDGRLFVVEGETIAVYGAGSTAAKPATWGTLKRLYR